MKIITFNGYYPQLARETFVAPGAYIIGNVYIDSCSSIWFNTVLRGDIDRITIGRETNVQDNSTLHTDEGYPTEIGDMVTVGHNSVLHGCTVEDEVLIGMGTVILNGSRVGAGAIVGAGALLPSGTVIPPGTLALGSPAKVVRELSSREHPTREGHYKQYWHRACCYMEHLGE